MSGFRISVYTSKELQSLILRLKGMDRELVSQINKRTRTVAEPVWKEVLAAEATDRLQHRVLVQTGRVSVSRSNVTLRSAAIGRPLSGGARPSEIYAAVEFGAKRDEYRTYGRISPKSGQERDVRRRTKRQFRPRKMQGYVVYPAAAHIIPRIASLWVQTVVRTFHEAIEGK